MCSKFAVQIWNIRNFLHFLFTQLLFVGQMWRWKCSSPHEIYVFTHKLSILFNFMSKCKLINPRALACLIYLLCSVGVFQILNGNCWILENNSVFPGSMNGRFTKFFLFSLTVQEIVNLGPAISKVIEENIRHYLQHDCLVSIFESDMWSCFNVHKMFIMTT